MAARDIIVMSVILFTFAVVLFISSSVSTTFFHKVILNPQINSSSGAVASFNATQKQIARADYLFFAMFIGFLLGLIVTGWLVGGIPIFMMFYVIFVMIAAFISPIFSNIWYSISTDAVFGTTVASFPITDFIMTKLIFFVVIFGFIGLVIMFAKPYIQGGNL